MPMRVTFRFATVLLVAVVIFVAGCNRRRTPVAAPTAPPPSTAPPGIAPAPATPTRVDDALPVPAQPTIADDPIANRSIEDLNRNSPLQPVFFTVDSAEINEAGRAVASANAEVMRKYPQWVITIEGHCDERGTPEYNLALGEQRAAAVRAYLVSLGIPADRVRTISYGKEFPFDPARNEEAYAKNRRGHFVITSN
jgi:peptidoglycan-associated lipoprotein